jgi:glutamate racemase
MQCPLVILACNTASSKALRTIQQNDLKKINPENRVLGVIRPTTEMIGNVTKKNEVGVLGTLGTVNSQSYVVEIKKFFPHIKVYQQACPGWVVIVENNEIEDEKSEVLIKKNIDELLVQSPNIDAIVLGCTHYPLLEKQIRKFIPNTIKLISQGEIVATSLKKYLDNHPKLENRISKNNTVQFFTTDTSENFNEKAELFYGSKTNAKKLVLKE